MRKWKFRQRRRRQSSRTRTVSNLKAAREARGLSLNDVFDATRVSRINLEALENDDFDRLPPPVYTRNFIRKYAQAVGVDEKPILDRYEKHQRRSDTVTRGD